MSPDAVARVIFALIVGFILGCSLVAYCSGAEERSLLAQRDAALKEAKMLAESSECGKVRVFAQRCTDRGGTFELSSKTCVFEIGKQELP